MADFKDLAEALRAVRQHYQAHPLAVAQCSLGEDLKIVRRGESPDRPAFYVLGFNGGSVKQTKGGDNKAARRWFAVCDRAADAVGADAYVLAERCLWGCPHVGELKGYVGGKPAMRAMLTLHARANEALFRELPPLLVWAPGVSTYLDEAIEDYGLKTEICSLKVRKGARSGYLWRHFVSATGVPFLFTKHPAARLSRDEKSQICAKLAELADKQRSKRAPG